MASANWELARDEAFPALGAAVAFPGEESLLLSWLCEGGSGRPAAELWGEEQLLEMFVLLALELRRDVTHPSAGKASCCVAAENTRLLQ